MAPLARLEHAVGAIGRVRKVPAQHRQGAQQAVQVGVAALQVPLPRRGERGPGVQDPGVVEDQAVARRQPQPQPELRPRQGSAPGSRYGLSVCGGISRLVNARFDGAGSTMKTLSARQFGLEKLDDREIAALSQLLGKLTPLR